MKKNTKKDCKEFEQFVINSCNAFCCGSHDQEYRQIWEFNHNKGFTITLHKDDQRTMYCVYGKFNKPRPEIKGSNKFSGKFNFLSMADLNTAKKEFKDHFKIMLNMN